MVRRPTLLTALALALALPLGLTACGQGAEDGDGPTAEPSKATNTSTAPSGADAMPNIQAPGATPGFGPEVEEMEAGIPAGKRDNPYPVTSTWRGEGALLEFNVWRMHCEGCASQVRKALNTIDGVEKVETDPLTDIVKVTLTDAAKREKVIEQAPEALRTATRKKFTVVQP